MGAVGARNHPGDPQLQAHPALPWASGLGVEAVLAALGGGRPQPPGFRCLTKTWVAHRTVPRSSLLFLPPEKLPLLHAMPRGQALGAWALLASLAMAGLGVQGQTVIVKEINGRVFLNCGSDKTVTWLKDNQEIANTTELDLGAIYDDPRGTYICAKEKQHLALQVYYRMCQNCIEVDAPTISGIVVADVIATVLLMVAVYCISGQDKGRMSRASDRQNLIANEQLYQPLGERDDGQYSRLAHAKGRK
ncbi:T-cell surface glycoprotein CD3 delta chain [Oxyura jamaicensis]|uniref:T-cell surface glycoprotein CD3 delta chain n=1 Tax=Oxyura jamaicensis TaxID=8884 RepID=UPI0015A6A7B1|nr:T-cell surface glycoprotein CD3 delta chain [Oxyura jamaicensis]